MVIFSSNKSKALTDKSHSRGKIVVFISNKHVLSSGNGSKITRACCQARPSKTVSSLCLTTCKRLVAAEVIVVGVVLEVLVVAEHSRSFTFKTVSPLCVCLGTESQA